ncbi:phosphate ABC transporter ATP-binding protein PstB [Candidatus Formimonas warabiya]|uniref:Phosphate ABC transporter ATP-binding protein n=1 Tax=Formimonas warabiya TaxID=1761012 RepID=A0A3G1KUX8_FORW1|nr:phosphate ABC transporter ATP-binding protein PstB [Candidatus Formimonas warabiya]ATW26251.1 phosphate ABC transporter ATP-binding protein [Candidatus Formimonas warabiya]
MAPFNLFDLNQSKGNVSTPGTSVIEVLGVSVRYQENQVLSDVHLSIKEHQITAFIGPSGCGKTTLLRCFNRMNDLIKGFQIQGTITFNNTNIYDTTQDPIALRKKIGMVFQQPNPFPKSIYNNMKLPLEENNSSKMTRQKIEEVIITKLKDTTLFDEVKERMHHSALKLSGGQQQRLCIARALTVNPEVLLLDEPCAALDPISMMKIENMLQDLKKKYTIVIVTHNLQQAARIADYVAFFYQGQIEEQGFPEDIFTNPKSEITAKYLEGAF